MKGINTVEAVKQSAMTIRSSGRFTKSIWKMWVKDRGFTQGFLTVYSLSFNKQYCLVTSNTVMYANTSICRASSQVDML